jgi:hypothetical protein
MGPNSALDCLIHHRFGSSPPSANLLFIAIGLPLIAAAAGWALGGRDSESMARQPT